MDMFSNSDIKQIKERGCDPVALQEQFSYFQTGFPPAHLDRPAAVNDGIALFGEHVMETFLSQYSSLLRNKKILKFVPASGAASRMFKSLYLYMESDEGARQEILDFLSRLEQFAFFDDLERVMRVRGYDIRREIEEGNYKTIIHHILEKDGLNYGHLPKALLRFHKYSDSNKYAIEEHFIEAALYARGEDNTCYLHFTVSPEHLSCFEQLVKDLKSYYESFFTVKYEVDFSVQDPATDTLAATMENELFRDENGRLLFRPGGHGALLQNLNRQDADLIFVKNIDNVTKQDKIITTVIYKKILAAYLLVIQEKIFEYLKELDRGADDVQKEAMINFANHMFRMNIPAGATTEEMRYYLCRPIRVCGMVKNEGEPGGGPFWVREEDGRVTLQIVEASQIDTRNPKQKECLEKATYFNPVDMVCGIKDYKGEVFDLQQFVDKKAGFISVKSYGDRSLKSMELPGLWNGSMAGWLTLFVEVPVETFNPVKTVFDLLKR